jgi:sugar lactone lactonase YvrE
MDADAEGNVYMADFGATLQGPPGTAVWRINAAGEAEVFASGLVGASGNDFDSYGYLLQSNIGAGTVSRIGPDGTVEPYAAGLKAPVGIEVVAGDTAFVVNCGASAISKITPEGKAATFVADSLLRCPNGIAQASDGNFYVANFGNGDVIRVTPEGGVERFVTLPGDNNGHILWGNDVLYVVARSANQIYTVTLDGDVSLLAGTGERGLDDGPALEATLSLTNDLALSPDGRVLYFNDVGRDDEGVFVSDDGRTIAPTWVRRVILR